MQRPHVICHMCTTIDAKILTSRWPKLPGGPDPASLFESTADSFHIPAWLVGTTTMKEFSARPSPLRRSPHPIPRKDHLAFLHPPTRAHSPSPIPQSEIRNPKSPTRFAIAPDAHATLRFTRPDVDGDHTVILTTSSAPTAYLAHLQSAGVSYLLCGTTHINLPKALHKLHSLLKIKTLLLEGGGTFNASMLQAGLVDEISQVILPLADAGGPSVPTLFHLQGPTPKSAAAPLRLTSLKRLPHDVLWLRYRVLA